MNIIDYIPTGQSNAISRRRLRELSGLSDRRMRLEIEKARQDYAILNTQDGSGYFRPTAEEKPLVDRWLRQERSRSRSVDDSTRGAEQWLSGDAGGHMVKVRGYVRRKHRDAEPAELEGQMKL